MKNSGGISIIIPTLNEGENLLSLLNFLKNVKFLNLEIIIVDGGSDDKSIYLLKNYKGVIWINSKKGRAKQLNLGANKAKYNWLYFLHADSQLPNKFENLISKSLANNNQASCFKLQFKPTNLLLSMSSKATKYNNIFCRGGDQSLLIHKDLFFSCGGYDERYRVCEDINLIAKVYRRGKFKIMNGYIITDSRRFLKNGTLKLLIHFGIIHLLHHLKLSPNYLYRYYKFFIK
tara:strand:- start:343 stop:1038 length:696 start_codon:yes stop_codon:yes gene_type:complete